MSELRLTRGDDATLDLRIFDEDGELFDLTGIDLYWTVKRHHDAPDDTALFAKSIGDGLEVTGTGTATVDIEAEDWPPILRWRTYVWDLEARQGGRVTTLAQGELRVVRDVRHGVDDEA